MQGQITRESESEYVCERERGGRDKERVRYREKGSI